VSSGQGLSDGDVVRRVLAGNAELYAVLVRRYRDRYARYAARMLGSEDAAEDAVQDELIVGSDRSDGPVERAEDRRTLERALDRLTKEQRDVFVLKHVEELSYEEIAALTGASVPSLKMRMHRAYDRLRAELKEQV